MEAARQCVALAAAAHAARRLHFARAATLYVPSTQRCWQPRGRGRSAVVRRSQATHSERASAAQKLQTIMQRLSGAIVRSGLAPKSSRRGVRSRERAMAHPLQRDGGIRARPGCAYKTEWHRRAMRVPPKHLALRFRASGVRRKQRSAPRKPYCIRKNKKVKRKV